MQHACLHGEGVTQGKFEVIPMQFSDLAFLLTTYA
jgi:hypothetical protein